jgi:hypothetical protein
VKSGSGTAQLAALWLAAGQPLAAHPHELPPAVPDGALFLLPDEALGDPSASTGGKPFRTDAQRMASGFVPHARSARMARPVAAPCTSAGRISLSLHGFRAPPASLRILALSLRLG